MRILDEELLQDTPFVAVDLDTAERNIRRMGELARSVGVKLRPHTKTHKSPHFARQQLAQGATGITTAKLGEAEVMADHGITDILVAFPIVGRAKLRRLHRLLQRAEVTIALDDVAVARGIEDVAAALRRTVRVYVDVDTGLHRMGRPPRESALHIRGMAAELPHLEIHGLMSHAGHAYGVAGEAEIRAVAAADAEALWQTQQLLAGMGLAVPEISVGATATARFIRETPHVTEMRPGMYVFNDRLVMSSGGAAEDDCALRVVATVVARPAPDRLIVDAGSKTLAKDTCPQGGFGEICGHPELQLAGLSEEHGTILAPQGADLQIGDVVQIIPNHVCPVVNLADRLYGFRDGLLALEIPVLARGRNR